MSLIDEALKRARQEASRQDAAAREARYGRVPTYVPPVRRSRSWLLAGVVAGCLVVGAAAGVLLSRSPQGPHSLAPSPATPPAPAPSERGGTPAASPLPLAPSPARPPAPSPSGRGGTPAEVVEIEKPALPKPVTEKPAATPAPEPAPPVEPPPAPVGPVVDLPQAPIPEPRSFVREMPLEGGAVLRLNGIAFSAKPVALFGDKVLGLGESAGGGFTVVEIETKRVKLQGPGGAVVYVSLR